MLGCILRILHSSISIAVTVVKSNVQKLAAVSHTARAISPSLVGRDYVGAAEG